MRGIIALQNVFFTATLTVVFLLAVHSTLVWILRSGI